MLTVAPLSPARRKVAALAVILTGLALRALLDKLLSQHGGAELVAYWAQLQSVVDVVSAVALAGVGQGLTVLTAQSPSPSPGLLRAALALGMGLSGLTAAALGGLLLLAGGGEAAGLPPLPAALALAAGVAVALPALLCADWLGRHLQQRVLAYTLAAGLALTLTALLSSPEALPQRLLLVQAATALALGLAALPRPLAGGDGGEYAHLAVFLPVGIANGLLTPLAQITSRAVLSDALTWEEAGLMQALWRSTEWITGLAQGVLSFYFLPRMAEAWAAGDLARTLRNALLTVALPAWALTGLLYAHQGTVLTWLYRPEFVIPDAVAAHFLLGDALRVTSWVFLTALFAARRTWVIVLGELLSLPLFALLLRLNAEGLDLLLAGQLYLLTYAVFLAFNLGALWWWRGERQAARRET